MLEPLDPEYQSKRWKLFYGWREGVGEVHYIPQGVFIPINPAEEEVLDGRATAMQGIDKSKLFSDLEIDEPISFTSSTTVRAIITTVAGWVGETKLNLASSLGTLSSTYTYEEGTTAKAILDNIVSAFGNEWFYDVNGILVARPQVAPQDRAISHVLDGATPLYITAAQNIDESNYYNKVTVVGGTADTAIYRATVQNDEAISRAGGRVVQKYFTIDAAVTQTMVDGRAAFYLSNGVLLPKRLSLETLVLPDLELGDILEKDGKRYEVREFNIPLSLSTQSITAGELLEG